MEKTSLINALSLFLFSIFAGTVRFVNKELNDFTLKALIINGVTALFSGMIVYFFTQNIQYLINNPSIEAGLIGMSGYMAPETLKFLSNKYLDKLEGKN